MPQESDQDFGQEVPLELIEELEQNSSVCCDFTVYMLLPAIYPLHQNKIGATVCRGCYTPLRRMDDGEWIPV